MFLDTSIAVHNYIKHERDLYALSALYLIYSTANSFEVWLQWDIKSIDLFRLSKTIFMNIQIRHDVILDTLMAAVNVLRQWKLNQFQSWRLNKCCQLCAI